MPEETGAPVQAVAASADRPAAASRWWSLAVVCLVQVMVVLDTTVVTIALPSAQHALGLSLDGRQWVVTAYTVTFGGSLLPGGRIGDLIGRRRALIIGAAGFAAIGISAVALGLPYLKDFLPLGTVPGAVSSSGTIALISFFVGLEVAAAFILIIGELLEQTLLIRQGAN